MVHFIREMKKGDDGSTIILLRDDYLGDTLDLYRAVGVRELRSIYKNRAFLPDMNSLEGRQFAFTKQEAINYAVTDPSKIAIAKAVIPKHIFENLDFSDNIDTKIFINGVVTVQPEESELFNGSILRIEIRERIDDLK